MKNKIEIPKEYKKVVNKMLANWDSLVIQGGFGNNKFIDECYNYAKEIKQEEEK